MKTFRPGETNSVVAAGMGTAIAVVLSMLGLYIPVFSTIIFLLIPLPIAYIGYTHGTRWSVIVTAGTLILDSVFFGVFSGAFVCAIFACLGTVLGFCYRKQIRPAVTLFAGALAVLCAFALQILFGVLVLGVDTSLLDGSFFEAIRQSTEEILPQFYSGDTLAAAQESMNLTYEMLKKSVIFIAATVCVIYSWAAMVLSKHIFGRLGLKDIPGLPALSRWELPIWSVYLYLVFFGLGMVFTEDETVNMVLYNLQLMCNFVFWLQGMSFAWWLPVRFPIFQTLRWVLVIGSLFLPFMQSILVVMGLFDLLFHYRQKRNYQ
jgi:hypothetical protein